MTVSENIFFADESKSGLETLKDAVLALMKNGSQLMLPAVFFLSANTSLEANGNYVLDNQLVIVAENHKTPEAVWGKESLRMWNRLQELSSLRDGWDGTDSKRMKEDVVEHFKNVLFVCSDYDFKNWVLFPEAHGFLYLDFSNQGNMAGISLTGNGFSYFTIIDGKTEKGEDLPFKPESVISVLRKVNG